MIRPANHLQPGRIRVGPAGWAYKDWEGIVYPTGAGSRFDRLAWIADWFDVVEVNVSYYRIPSPGTAAGWARRVRHNRDFRFTVKLHRDITHAAGPVPGDTIREWRSFVEPLAASGQLASCLAQFPWSFRDTEEGRERIAEIAGALDPLPLAIEVRHGEFSDPSWSSWLRERGLAWVSIDQPQIGESLGATDEVTSNYSYVRLHGRNGEKWFQHDEAWERYDYLYSHDELTPWSERIAAMASKGDVLVIMNNHWRGQAVVNAVEMKRELGLPGGVPPPLTAVWGERFPEDSLF